MRVQESRVGSFRAIGACIATGERNLDLMTAWQPQNDYQKRFMGDIMPRLRREAELFPEIKTIFADSEVPINEFMEAHGMDCRLNPLGPDEYGMGAYIKLLLAWIRQGHVWGVTAEGVHYPAFRHEPGYVQKYRRNVVDFYDTKYHDDAVAVLNVKNGDRVLVTVCDEPFADDFSLIERADKVRGSLEQNFRFGGVVVPKVDLSVKPDVADLIGLRTMNRFGKGVFVSQIAAQAKVAMDENGVVVEEAGVMGMCLEVCVREPEPDLVIDQTFLFMVERPVAQGSDERVLGFCAQIAPDFWRAPKATVTNEVRNGENDMSEGILE